jgi:hypothetical protein
MFNLSSRWVAWVSRQAYPIVFRAIYIIHCPHFFNKLHFYSFNLISNNTLNLQLPNWNQTDTYEWTKSKFIYFLVKVMEAYEYLQIWVILSCLIRLSILPWQNATFVRWYAVMLLIVPVNERGILYLQLFTNSHVEISIEFLYIGTNYILQSDNL